MTDNVRKIFDILGVEPNERFKVDGYKGSFAIDENLAGSVPYNNDFNYYKWFTYILINPERIIKLPKETKKKLRDLTKEEYDEWRKKNCDDTPCDKCIFSNVSCDMGDYSWANNKDLYSDKFLDQEIEVE